MSFHYRPALDFTERHGLFVALVGGTNSGKTYSGLRLARGIAGPNGKIAVADTEGGRTLHLKNEFAFDFTIMDPPHRPARYLEAARDAEAAGYDVLLIDSFSMEWRGLGGVIDWMDEETDVAVERARAKADQNKWKFDEYRARQTNKMAASIRPKMAHKLMVAGFLGVRMPIIFAIRGEMTLDQETKAEKFKAQCSPTFPFEVTVSFRLAQERKGFIDLEDAAGYKMEKAHRAMFTHGEQLTEKHGAALAAWAKGGAAPAPKPTATETPDDPLPGLDPSPSERAAAKMIADIGRCATMAGLETYYKSNYKHIVSLSDELHAAVDRAKDARKAELTEGATA